MPEQDPRVCFGPPKDERMVPVDLAPTDLLRRSTPIPLQRDVRVKGRTVRVETNSAAVIERVLAAFEGLKGTPSGQPDFLWRLVVEPDGDSNIGRPSMAVFSEDGLSLANIGQRNFIAVDMKAREAVAFLEERFARDKRVFERLFLATLVRMTAATLRSQTSPR